MPRAIPEIDPLEGRALLTILSLTAEASPTILRPINPQNQPKGLITVRAIRPVTLAGYVVETGNITPTVSFRVVDEYGRDMPSGTIPAQLVTGVDPTTQKPLTPATFFYNGRIGLNLHHRPGDANGRQYTIIVTADDGTNAVSVPVTAPPARFFHQHRSIPLNLS